MEDSGSRASVESCPDDFVIVNENPKLHLEGSTSEMKDDIKNILTSDLGEVSARINTNLVINGLIDTHKISQNDNLYKSNDSDPNDDSSFSNLGSDVSSPNNTKEPFENKTQLDDKTTEKHKNIITNLNHESSENNPIINREKPEKTSILEQKTTATNDINITDTNPLNTTEMNTTKTPDINLKDSSNAKTPDSTTSDTKPSIDLVINLPSPPFTKEQYIQDEEAMLFVGVMYLGSTVIHASRSVEEVNRKISYLNKHQDKPLLISLSIPSHCEGTVYLIDPPSNTIISSYPIYQILFCARATTNDNDSTCFAFTCSQVASTSFQCHVFRSDQPHVNVGKILYHFAVAFRNTLKSPSSPLCETNEVQINMDVDIREADAKRNYVSCPKDKDVFKLRCDTMKQVVITLTQVAGDKQINFAMCFGVLLSAGRNVQLNSMSVLEVVNVSQSTDSICVTALFDPTLPQFQLINTPTPKDSRIFMSVAVDITAEGVQNPLKFLCELRAVLLPINHKFWYFSNRKYIEKFILTVKENDELPSSPSSPRPKLEVISIENQSEKERKKNRPMVSSVLSMYQNTNEPPSPPDEEKELSDNDEPLLSGSGVVSKEVTDNVLLERWQSTLKKWHQDVNTRPKGVGSLVRKGVPEMLRGEVWQLLVQCTDDQHTFEAYRQLISQESPCGDVITRDLNRTFPAHEFFQDAKAGGQEALYRICKAYSIYDKEVTYCQGVSFLTAALLLHMPEEQAFCVLVRTMYSYGVRELFRMDFEDLHLKFFQLERCIESQLNNLYKHFLDLGLESHMYASQWFLTLFTAKFPLFLVFYILDLFFCEGIPTIFAVALALLKMSRKDLLALDFEGVLKYFRVQLPKKYRSEEAAREMMACAVSMMPSDKKLKRFEALYKAVREEQMQQEDPLDRLKKDNKRLQEANLRLETENDSLAKELVSSKIQLRNQLDQVEDRYECVNKELLMSRSMVLDAEEEMKMQGEEITQLKELCRRECEKVQVSDLRNQTIIQDYKKVVDGLSKRMDELASKHAQEALFYKELLEECESCKNKLLQKTQDNQGSEDSGNNSLADNVVKSTSQNSTSHDKDDLIGCLELELAQTKLALVECECRNQDLMHQLTSSVSSPNLSSIVSNGNEQESLATKISGLKSKGGKHMSTTWLQKTLNSIKEATVNFNS